MITSHAIQKTPNAKKYLGQLCKHFAHKVDVTYTDTHGVCAMPSGKTTLDADDETLSVQIESDSEKALREAQYVVDVHLERFAFREKIKKLDWV